jgi:hypothetical protein
MRSADNEKKARDGVKRRKGTGPKAKWISVPDAHEAYVTKKARYKAKRLKKLIAEGRVKPPQEQEQEEEQEKDSPPLKTPPRPTRTETEKPKSLPFPFPIQPGLSLRTSGRTHRAPQR